jgi:hypothetical protein
LWNFAGISNIQRFLTWEFCANPLRSSFVGNFAGISNIQFFLTWEFCANPLLGFQTFNFFELGNFVPTLSISPVLGEILYMEDTL